VGSTAAPPGKNPHYLNAVNTFRNNPHPHQTPQALALSPGISGAISFVEFDSMLILLVILILVFGFGGFRMGPGLGYYGGGGLSLILTIVLILLLLKVI
jgi:hypothetical protein